MKKLIGTAMLAALLATSAFAQEGISFSAWNNSLYIISHDDGNNVESEFAQPWGTGGSRFGSLNIVGNSENAGFQAELHFDAGNIGGLGQLYSWIKPIEQIQLIFGFTDQNYLRSDNCAYMGSYYRPGNASMFNIGEGLTFSELEVSGIGLVVTPIDALKIVAGYDVAMNGTPHELNEQIGRSGKLGAAYTIENIGTVKASFKANTNNDFKKGGVDKDGKEKDRFTVGVAFDLTAFEGVFVTVGAKIPLGGTYDKITVGYKKKTGEGYGDGTDWSNVKNYDPIEWTKNSPIEVNAGVALNLIENLGIQLNFASKINAPKIKDPLADSKADGQFGFAIELGADYTFAESWKVFGAVGYANDVYNNSYSVVFDKDASTNNYAKDGAWTTRDMLSFGVGIEKSWSNGALGVAFVGMTNDSNKYFIDAHDDTAFNWAIPIRMNVSF